MKLKTWVLVAALGLSSVSSAVAQQSTTPGLQDKLKGLLSAPKEDELIDPEKAFKLSAVAKATTQLSVEVVPAPGYYVYKERIRFAINDASGVRVKEVKFPAGEMKNDQTFGRTEVFKKPVPITVSLENATKGKVVTLQASYQGCHEKLGVCYPPMNKTVQLTLP